VQIVKAERREYPRRDGKGQGVAHQVNVITPEGEMGQVYLGGDSDLGRGLYAKAQALVGQVAEIVFLPRSYQGKLELGPSDVVAVK
jgi:hypothetical protein